MTVFLKFFFLEMKFGKDKEVSLITTCLNHEKKKRIKKRTIEILVSFVVFGNGQVQFHN